jgi:hypothetical protein
VQVEDVEEERRDEVGELFPRYRWNWDRRRRFFNQRRRRISEEIRTIFYNTRGMRPKH